MDMSIIAQSIGQFATVQLQQTIIEFAPTITALVVGFAITQFNAFAKKNKYLKDIQISKAQTEAIQDAAVMVVRSVNEKNRAAKRNNDAQFRDFRKDLAVEQLRAMFPGQDYASLDSAIDSAVSLVRPEKPKYSLSEFANSSPSFSIKDGDI